MTKQLTYRQYQDADIPALLRLWEEETSWGSLTAPQWRDKYIDRPDGPAVIVVAVDERGDVAGQGVCAPARVGLGDREVRAARLSALILRKELRRALLSLNPLNHPVAMLYRYAVDVLRERGEGMIYSVPDPRWMRLLRIFPALHSGTFPLYSLALPLAAPVPLDHGYTVGPLQAWDQRVDRLWEVASRGYGCMVARDSRVLRWKVGNGDFDVLGVERDGQLVGLAASRRQGGPQWLTCDLLAVDTGDALRATLAGVANLAHSKALVAHPEHPIHKVAVLATPAMEPVVRALGFARDSYDFPLMVHILDSAIPKDAVAPARWYISAND